MNRTIVTQIIPTIQGEGPSVGSPILLVRLGNCNLKCNFCDTKWSNNLKTLSVKKLSLRETLLPLYVDDTNFSKFETRLRQTLKNTGIQTIVLTGGEPLIYKDFIKNLLFSDNLKNIKKVEIETNGVLLNSDDDWEIFGNRKKIVQLNISPKLNPEYYKSRKVKTLQDIIQLFNQNYEISIKKILNRSLTYVIWKFVYFEGERKVIDKFIENVNGVDDIYIMPLTPDYNQYKNEMDFLEDYRKSSYDALAYCIEKGYVFVPRAHIWIFNNFKHRDEFMDVKNL